MNGDLKQRFRLWAWRHFVDHEARNPRLSYLFWEATLGCNMACRHCGSDCHRSSDLSDELTGDEVVRTFRQIAGDFNPRKLFIAVTGGEPLVRPDLFDVMAEVAGMGFPWGMVTNGWSVDEKVVEQSRRTGMRTLVVSLDGVTRESHDWLRGKGSFERAVRAIELYRDAGFLTDLQVTSTYHRRNIHELEDMFQFLREMGVRDWRVVSVFPNGRAVRQDDFMLRPTELQRLLDFIRDKRSRPQPMVVSYGDEGYLGCDHERRVRDFYYACFAGVRIASILANGDVSGCPNIPRTLAQGNVREESLKSVWENRFQPYRDRSWMQKGICVGCNDFAICKGNSMHLWDTQTDGPKLCHARMLREAREGVAGDGADMVGSGIDAEETRTASGG
ncbi:MAG: radical SAM protein [Deltaproteobacteria bacterium]|nr:radical SAM protein [Deltaproteobacteria bacterium]